MIERLLHPAILTTQEASCWTCPSGKGPHELPCGVSLEWLDAVVEEWIGVGAQGLALAHGIDSGSGSGARRALERGDRPTGQVRESRRCEELTRRFEMENEIHQQRVLFVRRRRRDRQGQGHVVPLLAVRPLAGALGSWRVPNLLVAFALTLDVVATRCRRTLRGTEQSDDQNQKGPRSRYGDCYQPHRELDHMSARGNARINTHSFRCT